MKDLGEFVVLCCHNFIPDERMLIRTRNVTFFVVQDTRFRQSSVSTLTLRSINGMPLESSAVLK